MVLRRTGGRRVVQDRMAGRSLHAARANAVQPVRRGGHGQEQKSKQGKHKAHKIYLHGQTVRARLLAQPGTHVTPLYGVTTKGVTIPEP